MNYYNEFDPKAAAWLRELIKAELIPAGEVDERSITEIHATDLRDFVQCHFFAGIAGWPLALQLAGVPADAPLWTGSCPCQPFSAAGKQRGTEDERHLWPVLRELIRERRPARVFGEQVASRLGREWLSGVRADVEEMGYAFGAADLCAAGVASPHIRPRLYWVADTGHKHLRRGSGPGEANGRRPQCEITGCGEACGLDNPIVAGLEGHGGNGADGNQSGRNGEGARGPASEAGDFVRVEHAAGDGREQRGAESGGRGAVSGRGHGPWSDFEIVWCRDPRGGNPVPRRVEPGSFPLAHGVSGRVGLLRGYGNGIVPPLAAEFIKAAL